MVLIAWNLLHSLGNWPTAGQLNQPHDEEAGKLHNLALDAALPQLSSNHAMDLAYPICPARTARGTATGRPHPGASQQCCWGRSARRHGSLQGTGGSGQQRCVGTARARAARRGNGSDGQLWQGIQRSQALHVPPVALFNMCPAHPAMACAAAHRAPSALPHTPTGHPACLGGPVAAPQTPLRSGPPSHLQTACGCRQASSSGKQAEAVAQHAGQESRHGNG